MCVSTTSFFFTLLQLSPLVILIAAGLCTAGIIPLDYKSEDDYGHGHDYPVAPVAAYPQFYSQHDYPVTIPEHGHGGGHIFLPYHGGAGFVGSQHGGAGFEGPHYGGGHAIAPQHEPIYIPYEKAVPLPVHHEGPIITPVLQVKPAYDGAEYANYAPHHDHEHYVSI